MKMDTSNYLQSVGTPEGGLPTRETGTCPDLSEFRLRESDLAVWMAWWIRSVDFYDDLAKWTAVEVIEGVG